MTCMSIHLITGPEHLDVPFIHQTIQSNPQRDRQVKPYKHNGTNGGGFQECHHKQPKTV